MTSLPVDDIVLIKQIQDPFSDGPDLVSRLRQTPGRRFTVSDDGGLLKIKGRRDVWVGKSNVAYIVPMTPERAAHLGDKVEPAKGGK
jgi:hypothetical protein